MKQKPMAQHASELLPTVGHELTAQYILDNLAPGAQPPLYQDTTVFILKDDSVVHYQNNQVCFTWTDLDADPPTTKSIIRTSFIYPHHLPTTPRQPQHLCHWPNEEDLYNMVVQKAYREASDRLGLAEHADNNLPQHLVYAAAPTLAPQVNDVTISFQTPDHLLEILDSVLQQSADNVMEQLPEEQFENLVTLALKDLTTET